jgi:hypothetical protein
VHKKKKKKKGGDTLLVFNLFVSASYKSINASVCMLPASQHILSMLGSGHIGSVMNTPKKHKTEAVLLTAGAGKELLLGHDFCADLMAVLPLLLSDYLPPCYTTLLACTK